MRLKVTNIYGVPALLETEGVVLSNASVMNNMVVGASKGLSGFAVEEDIQIGPCADVAKLIAEKVKSDNPLVQGVLDAIATYKQTKSPKKKTSPPPETPDNSSETPPSTSTSTTDQSETARTRLAILIEQAIRSGDMELWNDALHGSGWKLQAGPPIQEKQIECPPRQPINERIIILKESTAQAALAV